MNISVPAQNAAVANDELQTACLRQAVPEDEQLLYALFAEDRAAQLAGTGMGEAQIQQLVEMQYRGRQMTYAAQFPQAEDSILLGEDGQPVGRLLLNRKPECWRIVDIAVLAAHRGRGLGTRVLEQCQRQATAAGAELELHVMQFNPARRLYERLGFKTIGEDAVAEEMIWSAADRAR
jgi:ribosomal protein S18 acetylase RimI-like enzyme